MTKKGSTKIVNFMTPGAGVLVLGHDHISYYSEYALSSTLSIYSTLIAIDGGFYDAAFRCHCWFLLGHLSHSGDLLLWVGIRRCVSFIVCRPLTSSSQELFGQSLPNLVCSISRVRRQEILNFMTHPHPKRRWFGGKMCKIDVFRLKSSSLLKGISQTNWVYIIDD